MRREFNLWMAKRSLPRATNCVASLLLVLAMSLSMTVAMQAQSYSVLYSFTGTNGDGSNPGGGVVTDAAGNLYGTTLLGGSSGAGTVFKLTPCGSESVLHSFSGVSFASPGDGGQPVGTLVRDSAGNLYGVASILGPSSEGDVFQLDPTGTITILHGFLSTPGDGFFPNAGLLMDSAGNLYGTTEIGGNGFGTVFKVNTSGTEQVLYSFTGSGGDGSRPISDLVMDTGGNLYGTTSEGGLACAASLTGTCGTVFKVNPAGVETVLYAFTGVNGDGASPEAGLVMDSAGNLYGTTFAGGSSGAGVVFKLSPTGTMSILHSFTGSPDGRNPLAGLVMDAAGNLFGTTFGGGTQDFGSVFKIDTAGNETILHSFSNPDGTFPTAKLLLDGAGNLYGTTGSGGDFSDGVVFKLTQTASASDAVPIRYTMVVTPSSDPGNVNVAGTLGGRPFGGSSGADILTFTFDSYTKYPVSFNAGGVIGYENLVGAASLKITNAGTGALVAQASFRPQAGMFVSVDDSNAGIGIGSFAVADQTSPNFPGEPVYPFGLEGQRGSFFYDLLGKFSTTGTGLSCVGFPVAFCNPPKALATTAGSLIVNSTANQCCAPSVAFTAEIQHMTQFSTFTASAQINRNSGFNIRGSFRLGNCSNGINPRTELVTLQVGNYSVLIPSTSFVRTFRGGYVFQGTIAGASLAVQITPVNSTTYAFQAEGTGVNLGRVIGPVKVGLTIWDDAGTTTLSRRFGGE